MHLQHRTVLNTVRSPSPVFFFACNSFPLPVLAFYTKREFLHKAVSPR